ncbi:MAG: D-amino-acid transaminase, partial [Alphaproteobacteria bacterium]
MSRIAFVNGRYVPQAEAAVHIEDRGYQFADGVYEVVTVWRGRMVDEAGHLDRLDRSLAELRIAEPMTRPSLQFVMRQIVRRNRIRNGMVYMQVTRGVARRDHPFPKGVAPSIVVSAKRVPPQKASLVEEGARVISIPDIRWSRRDIKSISLLPNVLGKQAAIEAGAVEAWQVTPDGFVTEGTATNAWIVDRDGRLITHPTTHDILGGITRASLLAVARAHGMEVEERRFTLEEARGAREAFLTSATNYVLPIVQIDDAVVGNGRPGTIALRLRSLYMDF